MTEPKKVKAKVKKLGYQQHSIPIHDDLTTEELIKSRDGWKLLCEESEERERALGEENERLKIALHTRNSYEKTVTEMQEDIEQLNVENTAMREALEWYANESNYDTHIVEDQWSPETPIMKDGGVKAMNVLESLEDTK